MSVNLRTVYAFAREMYPKKQNNFKISYGTAGFRANADNLDFVMYRMGLLATLRSRIKNGQVIGVMITASHNPEPDNGVKLIDPKGEMLEMKWEKLANDLVKCTDQELEEVVANIIKSENINIGESSNVYVGMDNRYHSPRFLKAVSDGVIALKGNVKEYGLVTTPMMHYFVVAYNTKNAYGIPTEEGYYKKLITAFEELRAEENISNNTKIVMNGNANDNEFETSTLFNKGNYKNYLLFDGANGVGARKMVQFVKRMNNLLNIEIYNCGEGKINDECGADFVKVQQKLPARVPKSNDELKNVRCVSIDGDADRVVYYFIDENNIFHLLDGDRIAILIADYLINLIKECDLNLLSTLKMGLVQTAYANGASTEYINEKLKISVSCVSTGVKHLHIKALEYDIGIYFEANGHGTILFSDNAKEQIKKIALNASENNEKKVKTAKKLLKIIDLINETVGDAISDMLLVETILHSKGWDIKDWLNMYTDLPNRQLKIKVKDRNAITTTDAERVCVTPEGLQLKIDNAVGNYKKGRSFVRPSGTEDIVRVYAEATTQIDADNLAYEVGNLVYKMADGIGPQPQTPKKINSHI